MIVAAFAPLCCWLISARARALISQIAQYIRARQRQRQLRRSRVKANRFPGFRVNGTKSFASRARIDRAERELRVPRGWSYCFGRGHAIPGYPLQLLLARRISNAERFNRAARQKSGRRERVSARARAEDDGYASPSGSFARARAGKEPANLLIINQHV